MDPQLAVDRPRDHLGPAEIDSDHALSRPLANYRWLLSRAAGVSGRFRGP